MLMYDSGRQVNGHPCGDAKTKGATGSRVPEVQPLHRVHGARMFALELDPDLCRAAALPKPWATRQYEVHHRRAPLRC